ncbi:hypothetical protein HOD75_00910 [archaeon]|jgi:hypothetical protein|nr:hypothetical protein [archaeon]MBT4241437.1 hypothetical protein [archaeon]MBT4417692.1 hypothetical protein [archaeon]
MENVSHLKQFYTTFSQLAGRNFYYSYFAFPVVLGAFSLFNKYMFDVEEVSSIQAISSFCVAVNITNSRSTRDYAKGLENIEE